MKEEYKSALINILTTLDMRYLQFNISGRKVVDSIRLYIKEVLKDEEDKIKKVG